MTEISILLSFVQDKRGLFIQKLVDTCKELETELDLYIDSGAFTALMSGNPIKIEQYANFLEKNKEYATWYANLDSIGDSIQTRKNQRILEGLGFSPVPVFHQGSSIELFRDMLQSYEGKIALGGIAGRPKWMFPIFLKVCAETVNDTSTDKNNHLHIFGVTPTEEICQIHQWGSFDSSIGAGYRWNSVISPYGHKVKISSLRGVKSKAIYLKAVSEQLHLSQRTLDILSAAKKPTRGYDSGFFWNVLSMLCNIKAVQDVLDKTAATAKYYTVFFPIKSPYLELIISGVRDIYENRNNTCRPD